LSQTIESEETTITSSEMTAIFQEETIMNSEMNTNSAKVTTGVDQTTFIDIENSTTCMYFIEIHTKIIIIFFFILLTEI